MGLDSIKFKEFYIQDYQNPSYYSTPEQKKHIRRKTKAHLIEP